jgi:large subunit ribosomal protein L18
MPNSREVRRRKIRYKIRKRIEGTSAVPRLAVFRSNARIYAQLIDDIAGKTILSAASHIASGGKGAKEARKSKGNKTEMAREVGKQLAEKSVSAGITKVVFDRGGYLYHGRVKALAEGARSAGLVF